MILIFLYDTTYGMLCNSLDEQLHDYKESEGNKKSDDESDSKYMGGDEGEDDIDLDAKLFKENVVKKKDVGYNKNVIVFGQDKEIGARDSDDGLYIPIEFDEDVPAYGEF